MLYPLSYEGGIAPERRQPSEDCHQVQGATLAVGLRRPHLRSTAAIWEPLGVIIDDSDESISAAVRVLRAGGLVAVPTETVYGLAADASDPAAVAKVFAVKGRPADHPLIVHLGGAAQLEDWAGNVPDDARRLAEAFWPGPLSMVLERHPSVSPVVTGGRDTVAVRVPAHPVARRLLEAFGGGLAAPSANRFGRVSPTTAADVAADLGDDVDLVIDGGPCEIGVESTIVELVGPEDGSPPTVTILRSGAISPEQVATALGRPVRSTPTGPARAPGMLEAHYAPVTRLELFEPGSEAEALARAADFAAAGRRVGLLGLARVDAPGAVVSWDAGGDEAAFARSLYRWLRQADEESLDALLVVLPPPQGISLAVRDRLRRAAVR